MLKELPRVLPMWVDSGSGKMVPVFGGPFTEVDKLDDDTFLKIKMAPEIRLPCDVGIDCPDFGLPKDEEKFRQAVHRAAKAVRNWDFMVAVGCMGGTGRTGTFMACLLKELEPDVADPVAEVRRRYKPHAVETPEQQKYVRNFVPMEDGEITYIDDLVRRPAWYEGIWDWMLGVRMKLGF